MVIFIDAPWEGKEDSFLAARLDRMDFNAAH
jgi:hypothetical protein